MCNQCSNTDPREDIAYGAKALAGLRDLLHDAGGHNQQFTTTGPQELSKLLDMVSVRVSGAADQLQDYVPRDRKPPVA